MASSSDARPLRLRLIRLLQIRLSRLMLLTALAAVLFWAWRFDSENRSIHAAWASYQIRALSDSDPARRREAAERLGRVELDALSRAVAALVGALADPDWQVRRAAARALAGAICTPIGWSDPEPDPNLIVDVDLAVRAVIAGCRDPRDEVRIEALQALGELYERPQFSVSAWTILLDSSTDRRWRQKWPRFSQGRALLAPTTTAALEAVSRAMHDQLPEVRARAVWSFARVGPAAGAAADPVRQIAKNDPDRDVRFAALSVLIEGWPRSCDREADKEHDVRGLERPD